MKTDLLASTFAVTPEPQQIEDSLCSHEHDIGLAATPRATQNPCFAEPFRRPEKLPEKLRLDSKGPLPWSWTLPLAVDSPDKHAVSWTSSKSAVATAMSPVSSGVLSGAQSLKASGEIPHAAETSKTAIVGGHAAGRGDFANREMPERFLLDSKSPVPWCWRMPLTCDSPLVSTCNLQACHPPSSSASSGNRPEQQFSRLRDGSSSCTSIVVLLQKLGRASDSTRQVMELVRSSEEQFKDDKDMLAKVYRAAVDVYGVPQQGMPVDEFCDLSVKCIRVLCQVDPAGARKFHVQLLTCSVRRSDARIYHACAAMEEHLGSVPKAVEILQQGLELDAQPSAMLHRMLQRLKAGGQLHAPQQRVNGVNPMRDTHGQTCSPNGVRTPSSAELRDDAKSGGTARDDISVHFASLCEEVSLMRSLMEQNLRVQLAVQRDLQDLRAQFGGTLMGSGCCQGHACLRCCREAVEGAVETLMTSMVGVRGNVQVESTSQPAHDWQPLADEVWDCLTRVGAKRRRCEMQNLCCGINKHRVQQQLAASFAEVPELRKIVDWHLASAKPQAEILTQETEQKWEPLSSPDTATNSEFPHLVLQEPLQRQRAAPLLAVGEHVEWGVYKENVSPNSPEYGQAEFMSKQLHSSTLPVSNSLRCLR